MTKHCGPIGNRLRAAAFISSLAATAVALHLSAAERGEGLRVWDTGKRYMQKGPMAAAMKDKSNWRLVPYGASDYKPRGDLIVENEFFYLFLFSNKDDSVDLMAKQGPDGFKANEIYKVHQDRRGLRNFGMGTMWVEILKVTRDEVSLKHAGEGRRHGRPEPIVTIYRVLAGKPWLEVRPVERVNQQGMHGKSRICAFVRAEGDDLILDSKAEPYTGDYNLPAPPGTIGIINFSRCDIRFNRIRCYDFMWFMTFAPGAEKHELTYLGLHSDPFWEDPPRPDWPSVGAQYAYLGPGGVFIAVLNDRDAPINSACENWKREDIGRRVRAGETYTSEFKAPYAGVWKMVAKFGREVVRPEDKDNMVADPGAEGPERAEFRGCAFPLGWGCYNGAGSARWGVTTEQAHSGRHCVYMTITGHDQRPITNNALTLGPTAGYSGAAAFNVQPKTTYYFSFWLKGRGLKRPLSVLAQGWKEPVDQAASRQDLQTTLQPFLPSDKWQRYEGSFTTAADTRKVALFIRVYADRRDAPEGATIWVDDVFLGRASKTTPTRYFHSRVTVGAGRPFTFRSPTDGRLDYLLVYLWDRTSQTPRDVWTPMDVYRQVVLKQGPLKR